MHDVTMVINDLGNGGTQRVYSTIANEWARRGRKVCVITRAKPDTDFHKLDNNITRYVCGGIGTSSSKISGLWRNIRRIIRLRKAISKADAPVTVAAVAPMAVLSIIAATGLPTRLIVAERNDPGRQSYGSVWDLLRRLLYPKADLVTANSYGALTSLSAFVSSKKLKYLPNPLQASGNSHSDIARRPLILNVGRMYPQKAQSVLIKAFAVVAPARPAWKLAFAGTGPMFDELKSLSADLNVSDRIEWLGVVEDLSANYAETSIFVLPSHYEGMPNALLEAMKWQLACIVSDASPGPLEVIKDKSNGLVFPVDDVNSLAEAMAVLMDDEKSRKNFGQLAHDKSLEFEIDEVLVIWDEVLNLPSAREAA
jgi:GalNAc-alpha-(1->4)-GalNAc-alpha-(1->3)-diNAcBac-PP-undecaprenol alpha-1,4-N-acetyl-D-galactosaminyltransferase